ncbi:MAG: thiamine ABC transporter substrate-binding protein [Treponema sp.]|jgi:thiamine transport system substrate-binding protein|nr:thiamine ABC transporter substrate-binding protein [Treponema sp.]
MKQNFHTVLFLLITVSFSVFAGGAKESNPPRNEELVIWTYDSFVSEWGPGPAAEKIFEAETGIPVRFVVLGDAGTLLSRLLFEKEHIDADIILGIYQNMMQKAIDTGLLESYVSQNTANLLPETIVDPEFRVIPFDYSYFAIIYDSEKISTPPKSLEDLTKAEFADKFIFMDPRTSSPGLGFLAWTQEAYGNEWLDYWKRLAPSLLTIADGWSNAYGLFTAGEAPLVLSYTTSPGVHLLSEGTERYQAAIFESGHPVQIELAAILSNAKNKEGAKRFIDFMLTPAFQELIPETNWMYPVIDIPLPESFRINPKSETTLHPKAPSDDDLDAWTQVMAGANR